MSHRSSPDPFVSAYAPIAVPGLIAAALVLTEFGAGNAGQWTTLVRPVGLAVLGACLIEALLLLAFRDVRKAVSASTAAVLILLGGDLVMLLVGAAVLGWSLFAIMQRLRGRPAIPHYHPAIVPMTILVFLVSAVQMATSGALVIAGSPPAAAADTQAQGPNMYVVILDGYARQDTLGAAGFDNEPFLDALQAEGFDVYRDSRSNYTYTATALASILNLTLVSEIEGLPGPDASWQAQSGALLGSINRAEALDVLRARGYRLVGIPPVATHSVLFAVDEFRDSGSITDFERHMLTDTALAGILDWVAPDWIAQQYRDRVIHFFEQLHPEPPGTFVWGHVLMPHFPFVFDANGGPRSLPDCLPGCPWTTALAEVGNEDLEDGYLPQLEYTNELVLSAVSQIVEADPEAVIVLMGDHGGRHDPSDGDEWFRNLLAVRSPGHPQLLGRAPTSVNILPAVFNAYLGTDLPLSPNDQFEGTGTDLRRVAPVD